MSININPSGKVTFLYPVDHYQDNTDPHGATWHQDNLIVTGLLSGNEIRFDEMMLSGVALARQIDFTTIIGDRLEAYSIDNLVTDLQTMLFSGNRVTVDGASTWSGEVFLGGTIDGRDVAADAIILNDHITNVNNPHSLTNDQVSGIPKYSDSEMLGDLSVESGITVDEVDVSTLKEFVDGSTIPNTKHYHHRNWDTTNLKQFVTPEYGGVVFSGNDYRKFEGVWDSNHNSYLFSGTESERHASIFTKIPLSNYFSDFNNIKVWYKGEAGGVLNATIFDSNGVQASQTGGKNLTTLDIPWTQETISSINGDFFSGNDFMLRTDLETWSGNSIQVGEIIIDYNDSR